MNTAPYEDAWTELLSARRQGDYVKVRDASQALAHQAQLLLRQKHQEEGHYICNHTFDRRGVCTRCGYNASQTPK